MSGVCRMGCVGWGVKDGVCRMENVGWGVKDGVCRMGCGSGV